MIRTLRGISNIFSQGRTCANLTAAGCVAYASEYLKSKCFPNKQIYVQMHTLCIHKYMSRYHLYDFQISHDKWISKLMQRICIYVNGSKCVAFKYHLITQTAVLCYFTLPYLITLYFSLLARNSICVKHLISTYL